MKNNTLPNCGEFFTVTKNGDTMKIFSFLKAGVDPNLRGPVGWTALHLASKGGYLEIVKILLEKGSKVDVQDKYSRTALYYAIRKRHLEVVDRP